VLGGKTHYHHLPLFISQQNVLLYLAVQCKLYWQDLTVLQ
jgi:hypothetical protein